MNPARPLRDIFADPVGDSGSSGADAAGPADVLRAAGHPDLPDSLVAEAVGSYADTAPIEVAEHLSTYVMAHSAVPLPDQADVEPASWLDAVSTAPTVTAEEYDPLLGLDEPDHDFGGGALVDPAEPGSAVPHLSDAFDFGHGGGLDARPDAGPDLPSPVGPGSEYVQPDDDPGPDLLRDADGTRTLDETLDQAPDSDHDLDSWDDA